jgi:hypothetical protein
MFSRIPGRLTYANIAMTLTLVFAMGGGAYAANKYLITSTKQISPKVLKALKGKAGPTGPQGSQGAAGPAGPQGSEGKAGSNGGDGASGANGVSVVSKELTSKDAPCKKEGGSEFTAAEGKKTTACNGSPWTVGGTLPKGASETGQWAETQGVEYLQIQLILVPISFTIPLAGGLESAGVHFIEPGEEPPVGCKGSAEKPEAESGNLCVFAAVLTKGSILGPTFLDAENSGAGGAGKSGTVMQFVLPGTEEAAADAMGTWVVTG